MKDLSEVIADMRGDAAVLRRLGDRDRAGAIEEYADKVAESARDFLWWLSEKEAELRSGRSVRWLRSRYAEWAATGNARRDARNERHYRALVIPQRVHKSAAREAGREAARQMRGDAA